MTDITQTFGSLYHPKKAFLIYQQSGNSTGDKVYIESFDIADDGTPVNAHPLSLMESAALAKALRTTENKKTSFLRSKGLLPKNVLYLDSDQKYVVWHTPKQNRALLFLKDLDIPCGNANLPALIWRASKESLAVYAVTGEEINQDTALFHAPFFNIYKDGKVCMGNVSLTIPKDCALEDFITLWEDAFFNSYFSHLMQGHNPVTGNIIQLWKSLIDTSKSFPVKSLISNRATLKNLLP